MGAENLRDQVIFVNHAPGAIAPLDPELIQIRDAVRQLPNHVRQPVSGAVSTPGNPRKGMNGNGFCCIGALACAGGAHRPCLSAITVLTAHKEHVRKLGIDRDISIMSGR